MNLLGGREVTTLYISAGATTPAAPAAQHPLLRKAVLSKLDSAAGEEGDICFGFLATASFFKTTLIQACPN
jgi:hypothetical protein